jgi:hypothetical protein
VWDWTSWTGCLRKLVGVFDAAPSRANAAFERAASGNGSFDATSAGPKSGVIAIQMIIYESIPKLWKPMNPCFAFQSVPDRTVSTFHERFDA